MPTISLCMITKNEENYLPDCLNSVKGLVDEIIVVDTGSSDKTVAIAERFGAKVHHFSWQNDFSLARNESLKYASMEWILILDADEVIARKDLEKLKRMLETKAYDGFILEQRNYTDDHTLMGWQPKDSYAECKASGFHISPIVRVFRRKPHIKFRNKVHEEVDTSILNNGGMIGQTHLPIHHYGLLKGTIEQKRDMYLQLGLAQVRDNPSDIKARYEIARIYAARGAYENAIEHLAFVVRENPKYRNALSNLADMYAKLDRKDDALRAYKQAIEAHPENDNTYLNFGVYCVTKGALKEGIFLFKQALRVNPKSAAAYHNLITALVKLKQPGEAFKVSLAAFSETNMQKFADVSSSLRKTLGKEAEVYEAVAKKDYDLAEALLLERIKEQPHWYGSYVNLSNLYLKWGKKEAGQQVLVEGLKIVEDSKGRAKLQTLLEKI